jgi:2-polyprenyl-3-methyl-5-hydroxy-6-metoxy-1,4-benzoquinol methylase
MAGTGSRLSGEHSHYAFGLNAGDRQRPAYQAAMMRDDFNLWFDEAVRLGGLASGPQQADWSLLDMGCGWGQHAQEIVRRYPRVRVTAADANATAIADAQASSGGDIRFMVHDARQRLPADVVPDGGFSVVLAWLILLFLPDKAAALEHLAEVMAPGGVLMLGNFADEFLVFSHPAGQAILDAGRPMRDKLGTFGLETGLEPMLRQAGFTDVTTAVLSHPIGGATRDGQRWYHFSVVSLAATCWPPPA